MHINEQGYFERVWFFTFAVQRLHGVAQAVADWMNEGAGTDWEAAARSFFACRRDLADCEAPYLAALACARQVSAQHAALLAQPTDGDIGQLLAQAAAVLRQFAAALDKLAACPATRAQAAVLRTEAARCTALQEALDGTGGAPTAA